MSLPDALLRRHALLGRFAIPQLRPIALAIPVGIYATIAALIVLLACTATYSPGHGLPRDFWKALFIAFAVLQIMLLWIIGMHQAGSAVRQEIVEKSIDFFRLLPLSAAEKVVGIVVGRNIINLGLGLINTALVLASGMTAGIQTTLILEFLAFSWIGAGVAMLIALLNSLYARQTKLAAGSGGGILLAVFVLPYAISVAANWDDLFPHGAYLTFFIWPVRFFVFLTALALYVGLWTALGLDRRFRYERATLFAPAGVLGNLLGSGAIVAGLAWPHAHRAPMAVFLLYGMIMATVLLLSLLGAMRSWDDYLDSFARTGRRPGLHAANRSNLATGTGLILLWGGIALFGGWMTEFPVPIANIAVWGTFWLVCLALMEVSVLCGPLTARMHILTGFLAALYVIFPFILAALADAEDVIAFSPLGYVMGLAEAPSSRMIHGGFPTVLNLVLLAALALPIARRYRAIPPPPHP